MKRKTFLSKATAMMVAVLLVFGVSGQGANAAEGDDAEIGYITVQPRGYTSRVDILRSAK